MVASKDTFLISPSPDWASQALEFSVARIRENLTNLESFPERTEDGHWLCVEKTGWWVGGHWVGLIWLAFAHTQDPALENAARTWAAYLAPRQFDTTTHDLGFLFELSHILGYELTGDEYYLTNGRAMYRQMIREKDVNSMRNCYWLAPTLLYYLDRYGLQERTR